MYTSGWPQEMRERGISVLMVDCPGSGEALRFQDLKARIETEGWAAACVDHLETRSDVDPDRIGLAGWSLGGYYCPRAAAFEKRLKFVAVWGANHNWGEVQKKRLQREGENPVPHYWEHVLWVWGFDDVDKFIDYAEGVNLNGVVDKITVPFLIAHGENDRQISVDYAPPVLRPGRQQSRARAAHLHGGGGRRGARRPRPHAAHQRVRRRLGRGPLRRAGMSLAREGRPGHRYGGRPGSRGGGALRRGRRHRRRLRHRADRRLRAGRPHRRGVRTPLGRRRGAGARRHRRPARQRRRHPLLPARGDHQGRVGLGAAPRARRGLPPGQARLAAPQAIRLGGGGPRRLDGRHHRLDDQRPGRAHRHQGWRRRPDQAARGRGRAARHPRQLRQPRHDRDPGDPRRPAGRRQPDAGHRERDPARTGRAARGGGALRALPRLRRGVVRHRRQPRHRRRLVRRPPRTPTTHGSTHTTGSTHADHHRPDGHRPTRALRQAARQPLGQARPRRRGGRRDRAALGGRPGHLDAPQDGTLAVQVSVPEGEDLERFAQVVKVHLERFGQRDELTVVWDE